jgi:heterodisulfide reductase subunit C
MKPWDAKDHGTWDVGRQRIKTMRHDERKEERGYVRTSGASERPSKANVQANTSGMSEHPTGMQQDTAVFRLTGYSREDFSVCLGCKICASVCTVNDLEQNVNPQELLMKLSVGEQIGKDDPLVRYCTSCYRCTAACPWQIRIPEVVRALKETLGMEALFEKAFKKSLNIWGRVYEPFVIIMAAPDLLKGGYIKYMTKWMEYAGFHLPHKVKRLFPVGNRHRSNRSSDVKDLEGRS